MSSYFDDERPDVNRPDTVPGVAAAETDRGRLDFERPGSDGANIDSDEQGLPREGLGGDAPQESIPEEDVGDDHRKGKNAKKKKILLFSAACLLVGGGLYGVMDETPAPRKPASAASAMGFEEPLAGQRSTSGLEEFVPAASALSGPTSAPAVALVAAPGAASVPAPAALPQEALSPAPSVAPASSVSAAASSPAVVPVSAGPVKPEKRTDPQQERRPPRIERPSVPSASTHHAVPRSGASASSVAPEKAITLAGYHLDAIYPTSGDTNLIAYIRTPAGARVVKVGDVLPNGIKVVAIRNTNRSMRTTAGTIRME